MFGTASNYRVGITGVFDNQITLHHYFIYIYMYPLGVVIVV